MASKYRFSICGTGGTVPCNCGGPCDIGTDNFDRADADSLGGSWSERSGDADIVSNQLKFISAGLVRFETAHPDGDTGNQHIDVDFKLDSTSSYARGVVSYIDDSNYLYASVEQVSSCWVLRLRRVNGGADSSLQDDQPIGTIANLATTYNLKVCWKPASSTLSALVNDTTGSTSIGVGAAGDQVGLAGSANVIFDNFEFWILKDATHTNCPECDTECLISNDLFDRGADTNLGCMWQEVSGAWETTAGNQLAQTGTGAAIAKHLVFHPDAQLGHYVEVDVVLPTQVPSAQANRARVLVNYADSSNYHYAEFRLESSGVSATLEVGKAGGAFDSVGDTWVAGTYRLVVCWDDENEVLTAFVTRPGQTIGISFASTRVGAGKWVALAVGSASTGKEKFDNFWFYKHLSDDDPECPDCPNFDDVATCDDCCDSDPPSTLVVDLGAGGLTNDACSFCTSITGEIAVQFISSCFWRYRDLAVCDASGGDCFGDGGCDPVLTFQVEVSLIDLAGTCTWRVNIQLFTPTSEPGTDCSCGIVYQYEGSAGSRACGLPVTLTKQIGANGTDTCGGTLPDTITLEVV